MPTTPPSATILALTTEATSELAEALARALLARGLVACVSLQPSRSLYVWNGRLEHAQEVQLLLKTDAAHLAALQQAVLELHSYDTPEWLCWPASTSAAYGSWLAAVLSVLSPDADVAVPADRASDVDPVG